MARKQRIAPLALEQATAEQKEILKPWTTPDGRIFNLFMTFVRHPDLLRRWYPYGMHVMVKSTLPARDRELIIMRVAWLNDSEYEWGHHRLIAHRVGLTDDDLRRVTEGAGAQGWSDFERLLLRAVDELKATANLTDELYGRLAERYNERQMMDVVHTYGAYNLVSTCLNVFGVQLEEDVPGLENFR